MSQPQMRLVQLQNEQPKLERMVHATLDELAMRSIKLVWGDGNFTNLDGNVITIDKAWDKDELKSLVKVLSLVRHELVHTHPINLEFKQDMSENDFRNQLMPKLRAAEVAAVYVELGTIATAARLLGKDPLEFLGEPALFPLFQVFEATASTIPSAGKACSFSSARASRCGRAKLTKASGSSRRRNAGGAYVSCPSRRAQVSLQ